VTISSDVLARYAADGAREVEGVRGFVESTLHRHNGVRLLEDDDGHLRIELHLAIAAYLARMASVATDGVDVVVDALGLPS
jgi:hypothetical protein